MSTRLRRIGAIVRKDAIEFSRDRFWVFMTILGLVFYTLVFWLLPTTVDETVPVGIHGADVGAIGGLPSVGASSGFDVEVFDSTQELRRSVEGQGDRDIAVGIDLPDGTLAALATGTPATATVYLRADVPDELSTAITGYLGEIAFALAGDEPPVTVGQEVVVVGVDRAGDHVGVRDRMRPLIVFFGLMVESMALAALVTGEIQHRTVTAVISTPARVSDFLVAKAVVGTVLAFTESLVLLALTATTARPDIILPTILLGAVLVTGVGLIAGSAGRDFIGIIFLSMLFLIPLAIPAMASLFPGTAATWVQVLPTYGLVQTLVGVTAYGDGWPQVGGDLALLAAWCVVAFATGLFVLRRKVVTL